MVTAATVSGWTSVLMAALPMSVASMARCTFSTLRDPALIVSVGAYVDRSRRTGRQPRTCRRQSAPTLGSDLGIHEIDVSHLSAHASTAAFTPPTYQTVFTTGRVPLISTCSAHGRRMPETTHVFRQCHLQRGFERDKMFSTHRARFP
jgi:hypothetical protein